MMVDSTKIISNIIIAEDRNTNDFYPFSLMHSVWEIRCGALMLFEKLPLYFPMSNLMFSGRERQLKSFKARFEIDDHTEMQPGLTMILNASVLADINLKKLVTANDYQTPCVLKFNDETIGFITKSGSYKPHKFFEDYLIEECDISEVLDAGFVVKFNYLWDALDNVASQIELDKEFFVEFDTFDTQKHENVYAVDPTNIYIGADVSIAPSVVLDASCGAIVIGTGVTIMPQATIIGPTYIGEYSTIKVGAKIYQDCAIGQHCKIGGELENTIIHSYSNKQHDGFLGHSYIGEWVNLGADTNNSDLKNNYRNITVNLNGNEVDTDRMFLGLLCGDHTKSGINTMFNTGTVCGIAGILVRPWFLPNFIPSFSWGGGKKSPIYKIDQAITTARTVMSRRNKKLLPEEEELMRHVWTKSQTVSKPPSSHLV